MSERGRDRPIRTSLFSLRKSQARRVAGVAGRPLKLTGERQTMRHAIRRGPSLHERLAARVKKETRRLEPPKDVNLTVVLKGALHQLRIAVLPNDPRDAERRAQSGESVVAFVGAVDLILLLAVVVLLVTGTVMVYSASQAFSLQNTDSTSTYLFRQTEWLLAGGVGMYLAMRMDYRRWRYLAGPALFVSAGLLLLLLTHRFGDPINGANRWLRFSSLLNVQPSEVAKFGLILYAAHWFSGQRDELRHSLRGLIPFGAVVGALVALVLKQPDLGTTVVIVVSLLMVYFVAGARLRHLALLAIAGAIGVKLYMHHIPAYQVARFAAHLNPWQHAEGSGYQYIQILNALGTGGATGVGLGNGQSKFTIPEPHTDSIYAILGEEWGLVGTLGLLVAFLLFALRGLRASILAPDSFGRLLATGLTGSIVFQALLNMAVVANVLPFTGIPLPFISYGGSSLSVSMIAAGILLNISKQAIDPREEPDPAPTYFWWRHRRPYLSAAGRREAPIRPFHVGQRPMSASRRAAGR